MVRLFISVLFLSLIVGSTVHADRGVMVPPAIGDIIGVPGVGQCQAHLPLNQFKFAPEKGTWKLKGQAQPPSILDGLTNLAVEGLGFHSAPVLLSTCLLSID